MIKMRLRTALLLSPLLLNAACAHEGLVKVDPTEITDSLSLPIKEPELAETPLVKAIENITIRPIPKNLTAIVVKPTPIKIPKIQTREMLFNDPSFETPLVFDIPVAYNSRVKYWIEFFQTSGRGWFTKWLERSSRYLPVLQQTLRRNGLPQDLAYMAMIESGFSSQASSAAKAVGPWQFIAETGKRYGLRTTWWLDERRDFQKSTEAASKYLKKMYGMFHNWYLVAAGYNTGENRIKRAIVKHGTRNFWKIAQLDLETETKDYVPKLMAALLISKAPEMYGFHRINYSEPLTFELFRIPGGTKLEDLAQAIGVSARSMLELNPELIKGFVPDFVEGHLIRIPKGSAQLISHYVRKTFVSER